MSVSVIIFITILSFDVFIIIYHMKNQQDSLLYFMLNHLD